MKSALAILALLVTANTTAAADSSSPAVRSDPMMERYSAASEKQDWKSAAGVMRDALAANPNNADYHNLYAYSLRRSGTADMDQVFKHYNEALRIDPKHKAKEHLQSLDKICFFGCSEYSDLKRAISEHEAKTVKQ